MVIETYQTTFGEEMVKVDNENGTYTCMPKSVWDELQDKQVGGIQ